MRLIDADALSRAMYHEAFETDSDWQRWDSGCWIRYKMFENALENAPTIDAVPVVRCGECEYYIDNTCDCYSLYGDLSGDLIGVHFEPNEDHFCSYGERRTDDLR